MNNIIKSVTNEHHIKAEHAVGASFALLEITDKDFDRLYRFVKDTYGIDLSNKRQLISGRLSVALKQRGYHNFTEFVDHLMRTKDTSEVTLLLDKLTTNYTFFMREQECLELLYNKVLPEIVRKHEKDKTLAIWSAGCSTGEEPYNVSMYLMDYLGERAKNWDTRLLATDISNQALEGARRGVYHLPDSIPPTWKTRYFTPGPNGTYTVAPVIRNNVIFQTFNLMDPIQFRTKFDLILCRNVMIYFDEPTKEALVNRFYEATHTGGYLLISCSESLDWDVPYRKVDTALFQK
jgi:chemotaxis protein methyltransferase CheR